MEIFQSMPQPLHIMFHYNTVFDIACFNVGPQLGIYDFCYEIYKFSIELSIWNGLEIANMNFDKDPKNGVIKRFWCNERIFKK